MNITDQRDTQKTLQMSTHRDCYSAMNVFQKKNIFKAEYISEYQCYLLK